MKKIHFFSCLMLVFSWLFFSVLPANASPAAWPMAHHDAQHTGMGPYPGPETNELAWSVPVDYLLEAVIDDTGTIYALDDGAHYLYAINKDGNRLWTYGFSGAWWGQDRVPALAGDGTIYIGTYEYTSLIGGYLVALNKAGQVKWQYRTEGGIVGSPVVDAEGTIYAGTTAGTMGEKGYVYAIYPDGTLKWKTAFGWRFGSTPAIGQDGTVYVALGNRVYALNAADGSIKWTSRYMSGASIEALGPSVGPDGIVYFTGGGPALFALNGNDGSVKWSFDAGQALLCIPAVDKSGKVYVTSGDGYLYSVRAADGAMNWSFYTGYDNGRLHSAAIDALGNIYVAGHSGLSGVAPDGAELWRYDGVSCGTPSLGNDALICGSGYTLYKFAKSLILRFPFEDSGTVVADLSGNGNDGKVNRAVFTSGEGAFNTNAYRFDWSGRNNVQVPYKQTQTATEALTLEAWIYPTAWDNIYAGYNRIVSKYPCYLLRGVTGRAHFQILTQNHGYQEVMAPDVMTLGQWHYVVGTFDGRVLKLYVDGVLKGSRDLGTSDVIVANGMDIYVGEYPDLNEGFTGIIDNVAIYRRARLQSEIEETYTKTHYTLTVVNAVAGGAGGTITSADGGILCGTGTSCAKDYNSGALVTLTAGADTSSVFTGWSGGGCRGGGDCTVFMDVDTVITGSFVKKNHTISAAAGTHGTITPAGVVTVEHGATVLFTITPEADYYIADVLVDGVSAGPVRTYTFTDIVSDHSIQASFDQYRISGFVRMNNGQGISGVVMGGLPVKTTTDANGYYVFRSGSAWSGTITPSRTGYVFSPVSRTASVPPNRSDLNFEGTPLYSSSGRVTDGSGRAVLGVTISAGGGRAAITDSSGNYSLSGLNGGTYILTPSKTGLAFSPVSRTIKVPPDVGGINFQARAVFTVSGRVINEYGNPIPGARVIVDTGISALTDGNGYFSLQAPEGSRTFTVSRAGYTFPPFPVRVSSNISGLSFKGYDKPPLVMVHGWNAEPNGTFMEHGNNIPEALTRAGYYVEFARLWTSTIYTPPLEGNVPFLMQAIDRAKAVTGQPKVIVIAHSMGGLVSRAYIEGARYRGDVSALYTFGSPHSGLPDVAMSSCTSSQPAVCEMSPLSMYYFNQSHYRRAGVDYHVIGGDAPMDVVTGRSCLYFCFFRCWTISCWDNRVPAWSAPPYYRTFWGWVLGLLIPGQDDAFISTDSATGLSGLLDRAATEEVHGSWAGSYSYFNRDNHDNLFEWYKTTSYMQCLKKILVDKTTNSCGKWDYRDRLPIRAASTPGLRGFGLADKVQAAGTQQALFSPEQHTAITTGTLTAGKKKTLTIPVEGGATTFTAHWTGGSMDVSLIDPNGQKIDQAFTAVHPELGTYGADENTAVYVFHKAAPGEWKLILRAGADVPADGGNYSAFSVFESSLGMTAQMDRDWYMPTSPAVIRASFSELPADANVTASILYSNGASDAVVLAPNSAGEYEASLTVPGIPGYAQVTISAHGIKSDGALFERGRNLAFQISPNSAALTGNYRDYAEPRSEDPSLYQALRVSVGINSSVSGSMGLSADLVDMNGNFVTHALTSEDVTAGSVVLVLRFPGEEIFGAQKNGPYRLTNLLLVDQRRETLVVAEAQGVYTTGAYDYRTFAERRDFPIASAGGPYSVDEGGSVTLSATGIDPEGDPLTFAWDLDNDGIFETPDRTVTFTATGLDGPNAYVIRVQVTDSNGFSAIGQTTLDVMNVSPTVLAGGDTEIREGETFLRSATFVDPGPDTWSATVDYGDGTGVQPLTLAGAAFELNHRYAEIGKYPVTVTVTDNDQGKGSAVFTVTVSRAPGDMDGDGVPDGLDLCPYSDPAPTVVLGDCDSGVRNSVNGDGCTIFDRIGQCAAGSKKGKKFEHCVDRLLKTLKEEELITGRERKALMRCVEKVEFTDEKRRHDR